MTVSTLLYFFPYICRQRKRGGLVKEKEEKWLEALYKGENWAYKILFDQYFYTLSSFAARYLEAREPAEDIVQEVFYDLWVSKKRFEHIVLLKSYLYQIVRNRCLNVLKHQQVEIKYLTRQSEKEEPDFFLNQLLEEEVYLCLKEAVDTLPEQYREVYDLALLGHNNQEIADLLGVTLDSVKARKQRGKQILQEQLKHLAYLLVLFYN